MLSEERIRKMIRLADYEKGIGSSDLKRTHYWRMDYVRMQILKTILAVFVAVVLGILLSVLYHMDYVMQHVWELPYRAPANFLVCWVEKKNTSLKYAISVKSEQI